MLAMLSSVLFGQQKEVKNIYSGRITDQNSGKPISSVTIHSGVSSQKTISDVNGRFSIFMNTELDTLIFSHLNYQKQSIPINPATPRNFEIKMNEKGIGLNDIEINTGFQRFPKERSTGSFATVDNKLYNEQVGSGVLERLTYITNGISPIAAERTPALANSKMLIRGLSTFTFSIQKPLIIVDNFEYQGSIDNLNPNDIENITVLKDAAAGSIWGAKAANGVIVITTKRGKFNSGIRIGFNSNISVSQKPDLKDIPIISASDLIGVEQFLFSQKYRFADTSRTTHPAFSPVYEILFRERSGKITPAEAKNQLDWLRANDVRQQFSDNFYRKAVSQQYALNLSGGSDALAWIFSGGFDQNISATDADAKRVTLRNSNRVKLGKAINIDIDLNFSQNNSESGMPAFGSIKPLSTILPSYTSFREESGKAIPLYIKYRQGYIDNFGGGKLLDWLYYPLEEYKHSQLKTLTQDMNASIGLNYKIDKVFNIDLRYRYERQTGENKTLSDEQSYIARDLINAYSQINSVNGAITYKIPPGGILDEIFTSLSAQNLRVQLNAGKTWKDHNISFLAGSEASEVIALSSAERTYGFRPNTLSFSAVDLSNSFPDLVSGNTQFIPAGKNFAETNNRFLSFFTNAAYSYKQRYTISGSARRDASNLFGVNTNHKWKPLWSMGLAWDIIRESFFRPGLFEQLKLRGSFGAQGNIDPAQVAVATYNVLSINNPYTLSPISQISNYPNPELRWEQVKMFNLGLDFSTKNNRISGSLEYYTKHLEDLFGNLPIDRTTGISIGTVTRNIGEARGHGLDLQIKGLILRGPVSWAGDLIINTYQDKVTRLNEPPVLGSGVISNAFLILQGYPTSALFSYKWAGLDPLTGDPRGYLNGVISKDYSAIRSQTKFSDIEFAGRSTPAVFGSLGNSFTWREFSLSVRLIYKLGYYFRKESLRYSNLLSLNGHSDYAIRWQKPGDELTTNVPSFVYPFLTARDDFYNNAEILIEKADQIRLQYINFSYTINRSKIKGLPFDALSVYAVGSNLGLLWTANDKGLDPDYPAIRPPKQFTIGLRINY